METKRNIATIHSHLHNKHHYLCHQHDHPNHHHHHDQCHLLQTAVTKLKRKRFQMGRATTSQVNNTTANTNTSHVNKYKYISCKQTQIHTYTQVKNTYNNITHQQTQKHTQAIKFKNKYILHKKNTCKSITHLWIQLQIQLPIQKKCGTTLQTNKYKYKYIKCKKIHTNTKGESDYITNFVDF